MVPFSVCQSYFETERKMVNVWNDLLVCLLVCVEHCSLFVYLFVLLLFCWSGTAQSVHRNEIRQRRNFNPPRTYYNDITGLIVQYIYCTLFDVQRPHLITLSEFVYSPSHCKIAHPNSIILPIILVRMFQPLCIRTYIYIYT